MVGASTCNVKQYPSFPELLFDEIPQRVGQLGEVARKVLYLVADMQRRYGYGMVFPGQAWIGEQIGKCSRTIKRAVDELRRMGLMRTDRRMRNGRAGVNTYYVDRSVENHVFDVTSVESTCCVLSPRIENNNTLSLNPESGGDTPKIASDTPERWVSRQAIRGADLRSPGWLRAFTAELSRRWPNRFASPDATRKVWLQAASAVRVAEKRRRDAAGLFVWLLNRGKAWWSDGDDAEVSRHLGRRSSYSGADVPKPKTPVPLVEIDKPEKPAGVGLSEAMAEMMSRFMKGNANGGN